MRLLVTSTALSAGYYGWAVPVILDARDEKAVGLYMLVAGAGIVGPVLLTQAHGVSDAEATLAGYGGTRGIAHGIFAYRGSADIRTSDGYAGAGMIGSIAEGAAGFWAARRFRLSTGRVEAIAAGGDFGFGLGAGIDDLARFDDDGALAASVLLGSALGMGSGALLSADGRYTRGDAWLLRASGSGGAIIGAALATVGRDHFDRTQTGFALAGGAAGIVLGHSLAKSRDLTAGEGLLMNLGTIGGGLLGLGVAYVIAHDSEVLLPLGAAAGTGAGFWSAGVLVGEGSAGKSAAAEPGSHRPGASIGNGPRLALSVFPRLSSGPARSSGRVTGVGVRLRTGF